MKPIKMTHCPLKTPKKMSKKSNLEAAMSSGTSKASESTPLITKTNDSGEEIKKGSGLSVNQAALLVAGEMAGSGVLALPRALVKTERVVVSNEASK
ncbi:hypothetical protein RR48_08977 [Papilio machaon]|uniref:Uncharacterized protein n=1 Tax=Papilio machaon TaxID=76193 RepID=A0A194QXW5_PAPMA|nr:hypothetical protein RR48_08977 [Papilio machaon]